MPTTHKKILTFLLLGTILTPLGSVLAQDNASSENQTDVAAPAEDTTVVYDAAFFAQFNNLLSALDMAERVPGGQTILGSGGGSQRGFGSNQDNVLINGKRISGKGNDSRSALGRIPANQVLRIEIIRGSSPDVKVSSQSSFINIILNENIKNTSSGTWEARLLSTENGRLLPTISLSYGGKQGNLEYFIEASTGGHVADVIQTEQVLDSALIPTSFQTETTDHTERNREFSGNLTYTLGNGDQIRLNGLYSRYTQDRDWYGDLFTYGVGGDLIDAGQSIRYSSSKRPRWEIGGDYGTNISDSISFKILGLYSSGDNTSFQSEDALITGSTPQVDFDVIYNSLSTEAIVRPSINWQMTDNHSIEIGNEVAINKTKTNLDYYELDGGVLVRQDIDNAISTIKETRSESFLNHSWKINNKLNLESSLVYEYSKISQDSVGTLTQQSFSFLKPSFDLRYDLTPRDQLQFSVRRSISQLNFNDFASSVSGDDEVVAGNVALKPQKVWTYEASYEHRFLNDMGQVKASITHSEITDNVSRIEVTPGVSGTGNAGHAHRTVYQLQSSIRLDSMGLKGVRLDNTLRYRPSQAIDAFTGNLRPINGFEKFQIETELRHDINHLGLTYGIMFRSYGPERFNDIDELRIVPTRRFFMDFYAEKKVFGSMIMGFEVINLSTKNRRVRELYDGGVAGGILTGREDRVQDWGRRFRLSLKGTF